jgi:hypothetical protein
LSGAWCVLSYRTAALNIVSDVVSSYRVASHCSYVQAWSTACDGWHCIIAACLHAMLALMPLLHCQVRAPWEHASLAAQLGQLRLSLYLRLAALREPWDTWQHRSPSQQGGGSGAVGHVAALKTSSAGRWGSEPRVAAPEPSSV